ncbi:hypothetical protein HMPREF9626_0944 [Streptococcus parasanguinis F0405]|uniref:Uncharacterized protein n=1 Tax=Streptococcus parasanguinis F0405 TaxID=905067 RepID=E3CBE9_STRPA|nr:hypothetical protein HMPREF9626_0944 [Streptococcus parasanguinis F0405]
MQIYYKFHIKQSMFLLDHQVGHPTFSSCTSEKIPSFGVGILS